MRLQRTQQRLVHAPKSLEFLRHRGNERRSRRPPWARPGHGIAPTSPTTPTAKAPALALAPPPALQRPPLGPRQQIPLDRAKTAENPPSPPTAQCPQRNRHRPDSGKPPPAPSGCPASPGRPPHATAGGSPPPAHWRGPDRDTAADRPMTSSHGATFRSHTGNPEHPVPTSPHPVGDGFRFANETYLPDSSGPTGNFNFLTRNSGLPTFREASFLAKRRRSGPPTPRPKLEVTDGRSLREGDGRCRR